MLVIFNITPLPVVIPGSTQMVSDLAELAADAGNQTMFVDDLSLVPRDPAPQMHVEMQPSVETTVASDGFCLGSSEASIS